jgi:hypothetical protein
MTLKTLPKILTAADWNSKKGVIAKMTTETGIGAALTKLEGVWKRVNWKAVDPIEGIRLQAGKSGKPTTAAYNLAEPLAKNEFAKVIAVRTELRAVNKLAGEVEIKWKNSKTIPSSSRVHVGNIKTEAAKLYTELSQEAIDAEWDKEKKRISDDEAYNRQQALTAIKLQIANVRKYGLAVKQTPTVDSYVGKATSGFHQSIRGVNASLDRSQVPVWVSWKNEHWKPLAQDSYKPTQDSQVAGKVDHVLSVLNDLDHMVNS